MYVYMFVCACVCVFVGVETKKNGEGRESRKKTAHFAFPSCFKVVIKLMQKSYGTLYNFIFHCSS